MKHLSIIVPMYNVEPHVEKCLRFLENQDIQKDEYEIICINDGSPDDSKEVVIKLQNEFDNIILINQENKGVSGARNRGIEKATGKYILFIDPDDFVETNTFKRALKITEEQEAQVSFLGFTILNEDNTISSTVYNEEYINQVKSGTEAYFMTHKKGGRDPDRIYAVLFNRQFINQYNFRFLQGVPYLEDGELLTRILCLAQRCIFVDGSFYWRTTRPGSATNSGLFNSIPAIDGFVSSACNLRKFRDTMSLDKNQKEFMNQPVVKYVILSISATSNLGDFKIFLYVRQSLKSNNFKSLELSGCFKMYKKLGSLFNFSIFLLYLYLLMRPAGHMMKKIIDKIVAK